MTSTLLTIDQAAPLMGIRPNSLRELCKAKKIKHMKVGPNGGLYRLRQEWIDEYLEDCTVEPEDRKPRRQRSTIKPNQKRRTASSPTISLRERLRQATDIA